MSVYKDRLQRTEWIISLFWECPKSSYSSIFSACTEYYYEYIWNTFCSSYEKNSLEVNSVQSLSCVQLFATPWIAARQASLSITNSWSLLKFTSIESVMPSSHFIPCRPLLLLPPIPPSISLFQWVNSSHKVAKVLEFQFQHQSFWWVFRTDFL